MAARKEPSAPQQYLQRRPVRNQPDPLKLFQESVRGNLLRRAVILRDLHPLGIGFVLQPTVVRIMALYCRQIELRHTCPNTATVSGSTSDAVGIVPQL